MSDELKPCPFCGCTDVYSDPDTCRIFGERTGYNYAVACSNCEAVSLGCETLEGAVEEWNTRAQLIPAVKPLVWEDYPADDGPVMSKSVALHGTYFIVDDTDDFSGLYVQLISHDKAQWWQHVRSTCETLVENVHSVDLGPLKAAAQADHDARLRASLDMTDPADEVTHLRAQLAAAEAKLAKVEAYAEELDQELRDTQDRANAFATKEYYTEMRAERAEAKNKKLALELLAAQGQAADAINDRLAFGERVRKKAIRLIDLLSLGRSHSAHKAMVQAIRAIDLDALAEGDE